MLPSKQPPAIDRRTTRERPLSTGDISIVDSHSMIYGMLPAAVTSRIPKLPLLRRSMPSYDRRLSDDRPKSAEGLLGSRTPPPRYSPSELSGDPKEMGYLDCSSPFNASTTVAFGPTEQSTVGWKYANQGLNLLRLACHESSSFGGHDTSPFTRQLYIDSLTYLLRGLPPDLDSAEKLSITSALPADLAPVTVTLPDGHLLSAAYSNQSSEPTLEPSLLHRFFASLIVDIFIVLRFLLPYLRHFFAQAYKYDREHHICERIFSASIQFLDDFGVRSLKFADAICRLNNGKVGQFLNDIAAWWIQGVAGGIHEGFGEGILILRNGKTSQSPAN